MSKNFIGLLPSGNAPSVLKAEILEMVKTNAPAPDLSAYATKEDLGKTAIGLPVFGSKEAALEYEALNPGKVALYLIGATIETPAPVPPTGGGPTDFAYQWLGSAFDVSGWKDSKQGFTLTQSNTVEPAPAKSGVSANFTSKNGMRATSTLALTAGAKTITVVASAAEVTTSLLGVVGSPSTPALTIPGGGGAKAGWYPGGSVGNSNVGSQGTVDTAMHVMTVRIDGLSSTLTHDRVTVAAKSQDATSFSDFQIGGKHYGGVFKGSVAEVRIYNRRITDDELTGLHDELGAKYGVTF